MRTVTFYTLGCKVNQYETQAIREALRRKGFSDLRDNSPADVYVINTCTVTARADHKSHDYINTALRQNPAACIVVTGCLVHSQKEAFQKNDRIIVVDNDNKNRIQDIIDDVLQPLAGDTAGRYQELSISGFEGHDRAFLKVQDGCDNGCSYCIIPFVRGKPRSRPLPRIIEETRRLVDNGFKEIVLTGICLGTYGKDLEEKSELCGVLEALIALPGEFRLRLSSIEVGDISERLIELLQHSPRLCRHLHVPLQSGDNRILSLMNRHYSAEEYRDLICRIRGCIPDIAITTDIMVGFPSETEENFINTFNMVSELGFSRVHIFAFSPRPGTAASLLDGQVLHPIIRQREDLLNIITAQKSFEYRSRFIGKEVPVLIESRRDAKTGLLHGYSDTYINVFVEGNEELMNGLVSVKITAVKPEYTFGTVVKTSADTAVPAY